MLPELMEREQATDGSEKTEELYQKALGEVERWNLDEAEATLKELLEIDDSHAEAYNKLGVVFARREDPDQAEKCFAAAVHYNPELAPAYSNLGNVYQQKEWNDRALAAYEKAIAIDSEYAPAHHNLGVLYKKMGRIGDSVDLLKKASRLERSNVRAEMKRSPQGKKMSMWIWVAAGLAAFYFLFMR